MVGGKKNGFPDLSFLQFTIAMQGVHDPIVAIHFLGECETGGHTHPLAE